VISHRSLISGVAVTSKLSRHLALHEPDRAPAAGERRLLVAPGRGRVWHYVLILI
jgi:hypothetical protein